MSLKIRLSRFGKRNSPTYKVVVSEARDKRNGKFIDIIGHFNPLVTPQDTQIDKEKLETWKSRGAHTTPAVDRLLEGTYKYTKYSPRKAKGGGNSTTEAVEGVPEA